VLSNKQSFALTASQAGLVPKARLPAKNWDPAILYETGVVPGGAFSVKFCTDTTHSYGGTVQPMPTWEICAYISHTGMEKHTLN